MLSAAAFETRRFGNARADHHVEKPVDPEKLLRVVDYFIGDLPAKERTRLAAELGIPDNNKSPA